MCERERDGSGGMGGSPGAQNYRPLVMTGDQLERKAYVSRFRASEAKVRSLDFHPREAGSHGRAVQRGGV